MSTKHYFTYFTTKVSEALHCLHCGSDIQHVEINDDHLHYRCSDKECSKHLNGETVSNIEYPSTWVIKND